MSELLPSSFSDCCQETPCRSMATPTDCTELCPSGAGYDTIEEEATPLTPRTILNFEGSALTAQDNPGSSRTDVVVDENVNAIADLATTGLMVRTGAGGLATRTAIAAEGVKVANGSGIAAAPTFSSDIPGLAADPTPDPAADYIETYDTSAAQHKKALINTLLNCGNGISSAWHQKALLLNVSTPFLRMTPTADLTAFSVHIRGCAVLIDTVNQLPANAIQAKTFTYYATCQRNDANGGVKASTALIIDENSEPGLVWILAEAIGLYTGATFADIEISTTYGQPSVDSIFIYIQVEQHGPGTLAFL